MLDRVETDAIEHNSLKIGELLVNEGFIRKADLDQAVEIQQKEARIANLPLGKLMVKKKLISRDQLQSILQHIEIVKELETYALESGRINPHELARFIEKKPPGMPLAELLVTVGHLTDNDLKVFFEKQLDSLKICELAVETGMVSEDDLYSVLQSQRPPRTIGEILCELNLITPLDLNAVLTKYRKHLQLGEILLRHGLIDKPTLDWALKENEKKGELLGDILRREGVLTEAQLFSAFSLQYNIPFENLEGFEYDPGQKRTLTQIVEKKSSERFHIIPLRLEENTLTVAVSKPAALEAANSLRAKRSNLRTRCILVTPSTLERLRTELYNMATASPGRAETIPSPSSNTSTKETFQGPARPPLHDQPDTHRPPVDQSPEKDIVPTDRLVHLILNLIVRNGIKALIENDLSKLDREMILQITDAVSPKTLESSEYMPFDIGAGSSPGVDTPLETDPAYQIVFSTPDISRTEIRRLHHAYELLVEKTGRRSRRSSLEMFEKFIRSHYNTIRHRYGCSRIAFCITCRSERVVMFATPDP